MRLPPSQFGRHPLLQSVALHGAVLLTFGWMNLGPGLRLVEPPVLSVVFVEAEQRVEVDHQNVPSLRPVPPEEIDPVLAEAEISAEDSEDQSVEVDGYCLSKKTTAESFSLLDRVSFRDIQKPNKSREVKVLKVPAKAKVIAEVPETTKLQSVEPSVKVSVPAVPDSSLCPAPVYPRAARRRGQEGVVKVWVLLSAEGSVIQTRVEQSSGFVLLDQAALDAVRNWKFIPATQGGKPVKGELYLPIRFSFKQVRKTKQLLFPKGNQLLILEN